MDLRRRIGGGERSTVSLGSAGVAGVGVGVGVWVGVGTVVVITGTGPGGRAVRESDEMVDARVRALLGEGAGAGAGANPSVVVPPVGTSANDNDAVEVVAAPMLVLANGSRRFWKSSAIINGVPCCAWCAWCWRPWCPWCCRVGPARSSVPGPGAVLPLKENRDLGTGERKTSDRLLISLALHIRVGCGVYGLVVVVVVVAWVYGLVVVA